MSKIDKQLVNAWTHMLDESMEDKSVDIDTVKTGMEFTEFQDVVDPDLVHEEDFVNSLGRLADEVDPYGMEFDDGVITFEVETRGDYKHVKLDGEDGAAKEVYVPRELADKACIGKIERWLAANGFQIKWKLNYLRSLPPCGGARDPKTHRDDNYYYCEVEDLDWQQDNIDGDLTAKLASMPVDIHLLMKGRLFVADPRKAVNAYLNA